MIKLLAEYPTYKNHIAMKRIVVLQFIISSLLFPFLQAQDTIYVPQDYSSIQAGINAASDADVVLVDSGIYRENINFNGKKITVASYFLIDGDTNHINTTIIDGSQPTNPDYGSVVTFITNEDTTSVICGFTITGGKGTYLAVDDWRIGGGILCYFAGAKIINNKIKNNISDHGVDGGGAGIASYSESPGTWVVIRDNIISDNNCYTGDRVGGGGILASNNAIIAKNTIENNHVVGEASEGMGGGVYTQSSSNEHDTVFLINNIIRNNSASSNYRSRGGGVFCTDNYLIMRNNMIKRDSLYGDRTNGGGVFIYQTAYAEMTQNIITENIVNKINIYWGAGVFCQKPQGPVNLFQNEFSYNTGEQTSVGAGGGFSIYNAYDHLIAIEGNKFLFNSAYHGGGCFERNCYNLRIINNIFIGNSAYMGGAIGMMHGEPGSAYHPEVMNNTFSSNTASDNGGAIRYDGEYGSTPVLRNCIFWDNEGPAGAGQDIKNWTEDTIYVYYSDIDTTHISGPWEGGNNIFADPLFEGSDTTYYQLTEGSPCIDAGTPDTSGLNLPLGDIINNYRLWNGNGDSVTIIDMGAYEYGANPITGIAQLNTSHSSLGIYHFPNPTRGISNFVIEISHCQYVACMIYDLHGRKVAEVLNKKLSKGEHVVSSDLSGLPEGMYIVKVVAGKKMVTGKILLVK
jgi:hypothetical protein